MSDWCEKCARPLPDAEVIETLRARVAELATDWHVMHEKLATVTKERDQANGYAATVEAEHDATLDKYESAVEQLFASQHYAQQLRQALKEAARKLQDAGIYVAYKDVMKALSLPHDTSALDALVKERAGNAHLRAWTAVIEAIEDVDASIPRRDSGKSPVENVCDWIRSHKNES